MKKAGKLGYVVIVALIVACTVFGGLFI